MKKIILSSLLFGGMVFTSCNSLDVAPPNSITDEQVQEILNGTDQKKIDLVMSALASNLPTYFNLSGKTYTGYSSYPQNSFVDQDFIRSMMGNDVVLGNTTVATGTHAGYYQLATPFQASQYTFPYWALPVDLYTQANKVLGYLPTDKVKSNTTLQKYRGMALALRGFAYTLLMERFEPPYAQSGATGKGMPIYTEYKINPVAQISTAKETYDFILADLKEAVLLLQSSGVGYTDDPSDIDVAVAQYLLARAAIDYNDWQAAITACNDILSHYTEFIEDKYYGPADNDLEALGDESMQYPADSSAFYNIAVNPEVIMGFAYGSPGNNNLFYQFANVFAAGEAGYGQDYPCIDQRLYDKIDSRDFRKARFTTKTIDFTYVYNKDGQTQTNTIAKYANLKFGATIAKTQQEQGKNQFFYGDNIVIRASEIYLMLAEAYAQSGQDAQAKTTLNKLLAARTKAGEAPLTCDTYQGMAGMSALQMVQLQTRIEMWLEKGLEFYNNRRWNIAVDRVGSANHYSNEKKLSVSDMNIEVPESELNANGYWNN